MDVLTSQARKTQRKRGPSTKLNDETERAVVAAYERPELRVDEIAKLFAISRATVYNIVRRHRPEEKTA